MLREKAVFSTLLAFIVVFAFGLAACSSLARGARDGVSQGISGLIIGGGGSGSGSSGGSGGASSSPQRDYSDSSQTVPWPADSVWSRYGLAGLQQPPRTDVTAAMLYQGIYMVTLINGGESAFNYLVAQIEKTGAELTTEVNTADGKVSGYKTSSGYVNIIVDLLDGDLVIQMSQQQIIN